jgi:predicted HD phosphohydrolase
VTQLEHAIQSALLAKQANAEDSLIAAALLHDIGHLLGNAPLPTSETQNYDDKHENRAYGWLREHFGARVADPVRLHVAAKRYLCTVDPSYCDFLSPTSLKSFHDQGGVMNAEEKAAFEQEKYFQEALRLRRWDDEAKDPSIVIPAIEEFKGLLQSVMSGK